MERRDFLKNALLATGAMAIPSLSSRAFATTSSSTMQQALPFKKSIMWATVNMEGTILEKCKAIKAAGFDGIEPMSHMNRKEVLSAMKKSKLVASSVCCATHWENPLSSPDPAVQQKGMEGIIVAMEDAKAYGTDAVLIVPGTVNDGVSYDECWSRSTECIKKLLPTAEKLKVKLCVENVWNNFLLSPIEAKNYLDQFNSPYVKFYFDCGNILVYGWPEQWVKILGDKIGRIHIKEFSRQIADSRGRWAGFEAPLTEGDVNWARVMEEARKSYQGVWMTTEQGGSLEDLNQRLDKILQM